MFYRNCVSLSFCHPEKACAGDDLLPGGLGPQALLPDRRQAGQGPVPRRPHRADRALRQRGRRRGRRREQRSLDRLQPRNLRGRRRREDRGEVQADPDRQHLCQHERDGRGDRQGQEAPEALDGLQRAQSGGDRGRRGRRRPGRVQPVAAGAPETKSDGTPAEQGGKDNRGRRTGLRETAGVRASARKQTTVCVRTHCSNPKGGLKNIENHEITHTNE
mmetsp:Transcript_11125/g.25226  ORF Transcript_11125/g.25226 Transcript_11125/m.25226 type:complete len:218 (-) Transcript_11125:846-1499(-)